jgi:ubiquitin carboxyl-terminal hydrolase 36/42
MPADADILCEYYITSNLKPTKTTSSSAGLNKLFHNTKSTSSDSNLKSVLLDSIDFVKYDKNPMDYLKSKYQLLNTTTTTTAQTPTKIIVNGHTAKPTSSTNLQSAQNSSSVDLNWNKIKKTGIGLLNLGNNCYLNATLQCLAYTPPLSQWLVAKTHSATCKFKSIKGFCSLCEVEKIIYDIFNGCNGCAKPNTLCYNIRST